MPHRSIDCLNLARNSLTEPALAQKINSAREPLSISGTNCSTGHNHVRMGMIHIASAGMQHGGGSNEA